jgi:hypothetical protein
LCFDSRDKRAAGGKQRYSSKRACDCQAYKSVGFHERETSHGIDGYEALNRDPRVRRASFLAEETNGARARSEED